MDKWEKREQETQPRQELAEKEQVTGEGLPTDANKQSWAQAQVRDH